MQGGEPAPRQEAGRVAGACAGSSVVATNIPNAAVIAVLNCIATLRIEPPILSRSDLERHNFWPCTFTAFLVPRACTSNRSTRTRGLPAGIRVVESVASPIVELR